MFAPVLLLARFENFDLTYPAASVSQVVAVLKAKSGERLTVDPEIGREVVALRLQKTDLRGAMDKLSKALNASWDTSGASVRLVRTSEQLGAERRNWIAIYRSALRDAYRPEPWEAIDLVGFESGRQKLAQLPDGQLSSDQNRLLSKEVERLFPIDQIQRRLDRIHTPQFFERLGYGHFVFHSRPNDRQRPLLPEQSQVLAEFVRAESNSRLGAGELKPIWKERVTDLEVICDSSPSRAVARYRLLDKEGSAVMGGDAGYRSAESYVKPHLQKKPVNEIVRQEMAEVNPMDDPLRSFGEVLIDCAEKRGDDLVAVMGDDLLGVSTWQVNSEEFLANISKTGYDVGEMGDFLQVTPIDRAMVRRSQVDRGAIREWFSLHRGTRLPLLSDLIRLSPKLPTSDESVRLVDWLKDQGCGGMLWNEPATRLIGQIPRGCDLRLDQLPIGVRSKLTTILVQDGPGDRRTKYETFCGSGLDTMSDETDRPIRKVSPGSIVRVDETYQPCFVDIDEETGRSYREIFTVEGMGGERPPFAKLIRIGNLHRLDISVRLGPDENDMYLNRVEAFEVTKPFARPEDLPAALLAALRKRKGLPEGFQR